MKLATKASAGAASSSAALPSWRIRPSTITPTRSASAAASSKSCVTRSVGSRSSANSSVSSLRTTPRVCVSSAESGSSRRRTAGSRASARANATRWRSPPERSPGRALGQMRDPKALQQLVDPLSSAESDVASDVQVREERVLLKDEPDRAALRRQVDPGRRVEPGLRSERDAPALRPKQPCDRAQHTRLPRSRRSDERERLPPELEV